MGVGVDSSSFSFKVSRPGPRVPLAYFDDGIGTPFSGESSLSLFKSKEGNVLEMLVKSVLC